MGTTAAAAHKHVAQRTAIEAALTNEQVTRQRVDHLEKRAAFAQADLNLHALWIGQFLDLGRRGFFGRLRWLVTGR